MIMRKLFPLLLLLLVVGLHQAFAQTYTVVAYNIENLFDADGVAVFDDYKPVDKQGAPQYTHEDVLTKVEHAVQVIRQFNNGRGPDVLMLAEIEGDFTPDNPLAQHDAAAFLKQYANTTIQHMLGDGFNERIADLPSELLLLKGLYDAGIRDYDLQVGYARQNEEGLPVHEQKNVIMTRLPIMKDRTRIHPIPMARPILEVWVEVNGNPLVLMANHWKSGAGSARLEKVRVQDAEVLKKRLDQLRASMPGVDVILGGDFNSDYNQSYRYKQMSRTGINSVLHSTGDERAVAAGRDALLYNLWYELPREQRGSDTYRGEWGTLMQLMISPGLYDFTGFQYVDNSFFVGRFKGLNVYDNSGAPVRWSSVGTGHGFSDHLPVAMKVRVVEADQPGKTMSLSQPGTTDDSLWTVTKVDYRKPTDYLTEEDVKGEKLEDHPEYYDRIFYLSTPVLDKGRVRVNGQIFDLYAPGFKVDKLVEPYEGSSQKIQFYGRLSRYRGQWQFVIEDRSYLELP